VIRIGHPAAIHLAWLHAVDNSLSLDSGGIALAKPWNFHGFASFRGGHRLVTATVLSTEY
jgi:hypothetical protein